MVRLLIFIFLGYLLYRVVRTLMAPVLKSGREKTDGTVSPMVQDPACQIYIPLRDAAMKKVIQGQTYYFCSKECHDNFLEQLKRGKQQ